MPCFRIPLNLYVWLISTWIQWVFNTQKQLLKILKIISKFNFGIDPWVRILWSLICKPWRRLVTLRVPRMFDTISSYKKLMEISKSNNSKTKADRQKWKIWNQHRKRNLLKKKKFRNIYVIIKSPYNRLVLVKDGPSNQTALYNKLGIYACRNALNMVLSYL